MAKPTLYGIPNCDTVKRARAWLEGQGVDFDFHDFKKAGVPLPGLGRWLAAVGWDALLNRKGSTWRKLDDAQRDAAILEATLFSRVLGDRLAFAVALGGQRVGHATFGQVGTHRF